MKIDGKRPAKSFLKKNRKYYSPWFLILLSNHVHLFFCQNIFFPPPTKKINFEIKEVKQQSALYKLLLFSWAKKTGRCRMYNRRGNDQNLWTCQRASTSSIIVGTSFSSGVIPIAPLYVFYAGGKTPLRPAAESVPQGHRLHYDLWRPIHLNASRFSLFPLTYMPAVICVKTPFHRRSSKMIFFRKSETHRIGR